MVKVPVSIGELIDKLSILQVKKTKITNETKLKLVNKEFRHLYEISEKFLEFTETKDLYDKLVEVNSNLWDIEDKLRVLETEKRFDEEFIDFARKVYYTNDERFELKNNINMLLSSEIKEVKDYVEYKK